MRERGCARRRRERQHRAWHRHERMTVAMELAVALHHSAPKTVMEVPQEGVEREQHCVPRHHKPPPRGRGPLL